MQKTLTGLLALTAVFATACHMRVQRSYRGPWVGDRPPGQEPRLFAPERVSTDLAERDTTIPPGGGAVFYTLTGASGGTIVFVEQLDGVWQRPRVAPFSGEYTDLEPFFEPGSKRLWFASSRPLPGEEEPGDYNLWIVEFLADGWSEARPVNGLNGPGDEFYPAVTETGVVYFTASREGGIGGEDLFRATPTSELESGWHVKALGPNVNSPGPDFNAYVNANETLLLFSSVRPEGLGGGDLYVCFRDPDGVWSPARTLPAPLNSERLDYCPFVTADGAQLFFTSQRVIDRPTNKPWTWESLTAFERNPANGRDSIYWVDASVLDNLRTP